MLDDMVNKLVFTPDPAQTIWTAEGAVGALDQVISKLRGTAGGEAAAGRHALEQVPQPPRLQHQAVGLWGLEICGIGVRNSDLSAELVVFSFGNVEGFDLNLIRVERNQSGWHLLSFLQIMDQIKEA